MITYTKMQTRNGTGVLVFLDNKRVGEIVKVSGGYRYVTNGGHAGQVFASVALVKKSLEILD